MFEEKKKIPSSGLQFGFLALHDGLYSSAVSLNANKTSIGTDFNTV